MHIEEAHQGFLEYVKYFIVSQHISTRQIFLSLSPGHICQHQFIFQPRVHMVLVFQEPST